MNSPLEGFGRTHMCAQLRISDIGREVTLMGWVQKARNLGGMIFVDLRDRTGIIQLRFGTDHPEAFNLAETLHQEYVIAVRGVVRPRGQDKNQYMLTGEIEIEAEGLRILNASAVLPFTLDGSAKDELRLKYRYLDLRREGMLGNLKLRHSTARLAREFFDEHGFWEIETPMLTKSTPEGARDYLVPSRVHPGSFYALPQSPQLYKQILMASGVDRYFQIAKCFRDEDLRADRQPEFTQIDMEMSFVTAEDVMSLNERFLQRLFKEVRGVDIALPLKRIPYSEAMRRYGSDKPDLRFGLELIDLTDIAAGCEFKIFRGAADAGGSVRAINAKGCAATFSRKTLDALTEHAKLYKAKGMAWLSIGEEMKSSFAKFMTEQQIDAILERTHAEKGDVLLIVADCNEIVFDALGNLRLEIARRLDLLDKNVFEPLWVYDFPLLEYDAEQERYVAKHHPFTSPKPEDMPLLDTDPAAVRALAYDIVINGSEVGGGSIRIHDSAVQQKMFEVLGFSVQSAWAQFGFLLEAFKYGAPPHGGMAYGLDRLVMLLTGSDSIRDCIAFPKVQNASELMSGAPGETDSKQLSELGIAIIPKEL